jgi:hypothetical protein
VGVVVVVPALAKGKDGNPEAVFGGVRREIAARAPHVGGGVDEPGGVETEDGSKEDAPEDELPSAHDEKEDAERGDGDPVPVADPDVELVLAEVGDEGQEVSGVVVHGLAGEEPADVGPEAAVAGGVGIAFLVGVLMMFAVGCYPEDGTTFQGQRTADGEEVLHPPGGFVASMGEEAVVSDAYAQTSGDPPQNHCDEECLPTEEK